MNDNKTPKGKMSSQDLEKAKQTLKQDTLNKKAGKMSASLKESIDKSIKSKIMTQQPQRQATIPEFYRPFTDFVTEANVRYGSQNIATIISGAVQAEIEYVERVVVDARKNQKPIPTHDPVVKKVFGMVGQNLVVFSACCRWIQNEAKIEYHPDQFKIGSVDSILF